MVSPNVRAGSMVGTACPHCLELQHLVIAQQSVPVGARLGMSSPRGCVPTENRFPMGLDALSVSDSGITLSPGPGIWKDGTNMADSRVFDGSPVIPVLYSLIFRY